MTIRSLFVFAPVVDAVMDRGPTAYALALARAHGARLTVYVANLDVTSPGAQADGERVKHSIAEAAAANGVDCQIVERHSHAIGIHESIADHARLHDLLIAGVAKGGMVSERMITEYLLFHSGRPVIIVPTGYRGATTPRSATIAWDNSAPAARAYGDALALFDLGAIEILAIDGDKQLGGELDAGALVAVAARRGVAAQHRVEPLGGRPIAAALQDATGSDADRLLVLGARAHSRLHQIVLGSATAGLLDDARMPALLAS